MNDTICAISTPLGKGAISIVRLSGSDSISISEKFFHAKNLNYLNIIPRMFYLGYFCFPDNTKEHCMMVYFKGPKSYTGEDLIEFHVHGGSLLTQKILQTLVSGGAKLAMPGEFSKRAFENGKISLDQAESIIDEINAESEGELKATLSLSEGKLKNKILSLQNSLTESIAQIEATLDYPEEDFEKSAKDGIYENLKEIDNQISSFIDTSESSRYLTNGINIAIIGSPNVGKSSLLNALVGKNRAIVTDVEGTTRDILNESISYKGINLNFIDTAGIRNSQDTVEKIGIERSKKSLEQADVILFVLDGSKVLTDSDLEIKQMLTQYSNVITIVNKIDKERKLEKLDDEIVISALKEQNIEKIKDIIYKMVIGEEIDYNKTIITNERQISILHDCKNVLNELFDSFDESMDIIAMLIKKLWNTLGKITGQCENEQIIDLIFSKFCLGK